MEKIKILNRVKEIYNKGFNIIEYLREKENLNSVEDILISYDFQAGTYMKAYEEDPTFHDKYCSKLAKIIDNLDGCKSILEVGVGEATTLGNLIRLLKKKPQRCYGFDISWSRIKYAKKFLNKLNINDVDLFTGDLFCSPIKNDSIDIVYTSHSIEPNGGREKEALIELYRITNKYLILLEPCYELADEKSRQRMLKNGYVTKLYSTVKELGYEVIEHKLFGINSNQLNPTGLIIIKKNGINEELYPLCCPVTKSNIIKRDNAYFSESSLLAYPIIDGIPCMLQQNAIVATKFLD